MEWSIETLAEPTELAVTLEEAKLHLRVDHDEEDALIERLILAATEDAEAFQGRSLTTRTLRLHMDRFPTENGAIYLPYGPVQAVEEVAYIDAGGAKNVIASSHYAVDKVRSPSRIVPVAGHTWPNASLLAIGAVSVTYTAGYGNGPEYVPANVKQAILLMVGHLYENREAVSADRAIPTELPMGVKYLLMKHRVFVPEVK